MTPNTYKEKKKKEKENWIFGFQSATTVIKK